MPMCYLYRYGSALISILAFPAYVKILLNHQKCGVKKERRTHFAFSIISIFCEKNSDYLRLVSEESFGPGIFYIMFCFINSVGNPVKRKWFAVVWV